MSSLRSAVEQLSIKVCAMTDRHESTITGLWMSNTNCGFLIMFTQNLRNKLKREISIKSKVSFIYSFKRYSYLNTFQVIQVRFKE